MSPNKCKQRPNEHDQVVGTGTNKCTTEWAQMNGGKGRHAHMQRVGIHATPVWAAAAAAAPAATAAAGAELQWEQQQQQQQQEWQQWLQQQEWVCAYAEGGRTRNICMYKIFRPKFSICDLYILFEPVCNILHNKIQIWTFDSDNKINVLQGFNYVLGFFIWTDLKLDSNSLTKYFQHLASQKIVLCLRCIQLFVLVPVVILCKNGDSCKSWVLVGILVFSQPLVKLVM